MGKVVLYDYPMYLTLFNPTTEEINNANKILEDNKVESSTDEKNLDYKELYEQIINLKDNVKSINEIRKLLGSLKKENELIHNEKNQCINIKLKEIDTYLALVDSTEVKDLIYPELTFCANELMEIVDPEEMSFEEESPQDVGLIYALLS